MQSLSRRGLACLVVIGGLVLACSGSPASPGAPASAAGGAPSASTGIFGSLSVPSIAAPSIALPSVPPSLALPTGRGSIAIPSFSFPSEDKDLEARLPSAVNGVTLTKYSLKGANFMTTQNPGAKALTDMLSSIGKNPSDVSVAVAADPSGNLGISIGAFRVAGTDSGALLAAFVAATQKETPSDVVTPANVGGENVTQITNPTDTEAGTIDVYASADTLFYVQAKDANLAAAALAALP